MDFNDILDMYMVSRTCPVIHLSNGMYVTCTSFQPGNNNESMLFYYKNSDNPIEISGTYNSTYYHYNSDTQTWGITMQ